MKNLPKTIQPKVAEPALLPGSVCVKLALLTYTPQCVSGGQWDPPCPWTSATTSLTPLPACPLHPASSSPCQVSRGQGWEEGKAASQLRGAGKTELGGRLSID